MAPPSGIAFLLSQLGAHVTDQLARRLKEVDLTPAHLGILRTVGQHPGLSQKALSGHLGAVPSRMVTLLDELEDRGLVERRRSETDRRHHELFISADAAATMRTVMSAVVENDLAVTRALTEEERRELARLLSTIAEDQGLAGGTHPGLGPSR